MLNEWTYWLSSLHPEEVIFVLGPLVLVDGPRYVLSKLLMCAWDVARWTYCWLLGRETVHTYSYCPSVCAIIPACNEGELIGRTLQSLWGTYPRLEIVVVDEASEDDTVRIARRFAQSHQGVLVLTKPRRGGKSSAVNFARNYTDADVLVVIDGDSILGPKAIWEIVQPLANPRIGVASGMIRSLNAFQNVVTRLQALEYLNTILAWIPIAPYSPKDFGAVSSGDGLR